MTVIHIPMKNQPGANEQEAEARYRELFPHDAVETRLRTLADAGFDAVPATGAQRLAAGSLKWGTATEGALRILSSRQNAQSARLHAADALAAAVRVSRGLSEDARTSGDPWTKELLRAARVLSNPSALRVTAALDAAETFQEQSQARVLTLDTYLASFEAHGYALAGALLADFDLVSPEASEPLVSFTSALGALYGVTTECQRVLDAKRQRHAVSPIVRAIEDGNEAGLRDAWTGFAESEKGTLLQSFVVKTAKSLLTSGDQLGHHYPDKGNYSELYLRARITLNAAKDLLRLL